MAKLYTKIPKGLKGICSSLNRMQREGEGVGMRLALGMGELITC